MSGQFIEAISNLYNQKAPRWFRAIRWNQKVWGKFLISQKYCMIYTYPCIAYFYFFHNATSWPWHLYIYRPQSEEELEALKQNTLNATSVHQRDWKMGQYIHNVPPKYDLSRRRLKYPEYYEGRYDGFEKDSDAVLGLKPVERADIRLRTKKEDD